MIMRCLDPRSALFSPLPPFSCLWRPSTFICFLLSRALYLLHLPTPCPYPTPPPLVIPLPPYHLPNPLLYHQELNAHPPIVSGALLKDFQGIVFTYDFSPVSE